MIFIVVYFLDFVIRRFLLRGRFDLRLFPPKNVFVVRGDFLLWTACSEESVFKK
jgi:hypothetical protein